MHSSGGAFSVISSCNVVTLEKK